jgi:signal transduction histidine kinase
MEHHSNKHQTILAFVPAKIPTTIKIANSTLVLENKTKFSVPDLLPAITHELKTPLSAIIGLADILEGDILNPESLQECLEYIRDIKKTAYEMNDLVHDLLDVSTAASGNFSVDLSQEIDVIDTIKRSVKLNCDYAIRRKVVLKTEIIGDVKAAKLDAKRMKQILTNLISNAIKYSPENTEVKISAKFTDKFLEISIKDQGFGMTAQQVKTAFVKYKTITNPNTGIVDSFGLGLPITEQLVELQNGTIEVKSQPNQGTEVRLFFPYKM